MPIKTFDIKRDMAIVRAGGFFCQACLVGKPAGEQSPDPRYCRGCYKFLLQETEMLTGHPKRKPTWIPISPIRPKGIKEKEDATVSLYGSRNMHTIDGAKKQGVHISSQDTHLGPKKRGPKHRVLPDDLICQWAGEGMGAKMIAYRLKRELGIKVHYSSIQRRLQGVLL